MVSGDAIANLSSIVSVLSPEIAERIGGLVIVLQAVGIAFIIYVFYLVVNFILNIKRYRKINVLEEKIDIISKKIDKMLRRK